MAFNIRALARPCLGLITDLSASSRIQMRSMEFSKDLPSVRLLSPLSSSARSGVPGLDSSNTTIAAVLSKWENKFKDEGVAEPKDSIRNIVLHVMGGKSFSELDRHSTVEMTSDELLETDRLCECRLARMPVQYIIGEWEFRGISLKMVPPVFIPRPETEILVDVAVAALPHGKECDNCSIAEGCHVNVLEVGSGCGAISLSLMKEHPKVYCTAVDQSTTACRLTMENAMSAGFARRINVIHAKLAEDGTFNKALGHDKFDLIVSNPPYVPSQDMLSLEPEIKLYEDLRALDGGVDGLRLVKPLIKVASKFLRHKGRLVMEVDPSHPEAIQKWISEEAQSNLRLKYEATHQDYSHKPRFVQLIKMKTA
ncbi:MTRF1L release factor glutamine methyltransferase [Frankliniella occidentalis]|uniref:peptide chain release factor N(5)-glutamine methyltransferase n=1 Tax=Frankliniella occidentalis TaxID=133901 RepID=A0A6J1SLR6_FRAOC|nr:MTRF1L release factor glutamine methyltransferase [Frankliniella occidentalis]